jgi:cell division protein FtsL
MIVLKRVLIVAIVALITYAIYEQRKTIKQLDTTVKELKNQNDALQDSLFQTGVELGRYQMTLEILKDGEDKKAAQTFEYVLTTQTE